MTKLIRKIFVIGINSYEFKELPQKLQNLFIKTQNIAVPDSYFKNIHLWAEQKTNKNQIFFPSSSDKKLIEWLKSQETDVIIISRGDPLWFGIGRLLLKNFSKEELEFYPSNTCVQLAFKKLKIPWQETNTISIHGRDTTKLIKALNSKPSSLAIITDSKNKGLETIQKNLIELNIDKYYEFWLCEELNLENERIRKLNINKKLPSNISKLNIAILLKKETDYMDKNIPLFGLKDESFQTFEDRPNLLTKREVRIQILADLELPEKGRIYDIGAGCGSIGLEALKLRPNLDLFCIDKRVGSKELILKNAKRLGVKPKEIVEEDVNKMENLQYFNNLEEVKRVVIGGCDKKTKIFLINKFSQSMRNGTIIVIPIIDIQIIKELKRVLEEKKFKTTLNLIQTYKSLSISEGLRLEPNNPVFLLKGKKQV